jgi:hypothetical protein
LDKTTSVSRPTYQNLKKEITHSFSLISFSRFAETLKKVKKVECCRCSVVALVFSFQNKYTD